MGTNPNTMDIHNYKRLQLLLADIRRYQAELKGEIEKKNNFGISGSERPMIDRFFNRTIENIAKIEKLLARNKNGALDFGTKNSDFKELEKLIQHGMEDLKRDRKAIEPIFKKQHKIKADFNDFYTSVSRFFKNIAHKVKTLLLNKNKPQELFSSEKLPQVLKAIKTSLQESKKTSKPVSPVSKEEPSSPVLKSPVSRQSQQPMTFSPLPPLTPTTESKERNGVIFQRDQVPYNILLNRFQNGFAKWLIRESSEPGHISLDYLSRDRKEIHSIRLALTEEDTWERQIRIGYDENKKPVFKQVAELKKIDGTLTLSKDNMVALFKLVEEETGYTGATLLQPDSSQTSNLKLFSEFSASKEELRTGHYASFEEPGPKTTPYSHFE